VDREEPESFEANRPGQGVDDDGVEGELLRSVGLLPSFESPVDFECGAVDSDRGADAVEEEGARMLTIDSILAYVLSPSWSVVPKTTYSVSGWECLRCGHKWVPRIKREPKRCPGCKSPYWNRKRTRSHTGSPAGRSGPHDPIRRKKETSPP
jgi:hypothetical protein